MSGGWPVFVVKNTSSESGNTTSNPFESENTTPNPFGNIFDVDINITNLKKRLNQTRFFLEVVVADITHNRTNTTTETRHFQMADHIVVDIVSD
jgi:hypothetical protein